MTFWKAGIFSVIEFEVTDHFQYIIVHRGLVNDVKILHRDISSYNILMYPKHNPNASKGKELVHNPPIFINQILSAVANMNGSKNSKDPVPR